MNGINTDSSAAPKVLSENGKTYFYLDVSRPTLQQTQHQAKPLSRDELKLRALIQLAEPLEGPLRFSGENNEMLPEPVDNCHNYGEHMVVRNAREMFENVDILTDGRYFCRVCNRTYKTHATLTAHLRGCHLRQESPCGERGCNYVSFTENDRRKHQKIHDKTKAKEYMTSYSKQLVQKRMEQSCLRFPIPTEDLIHEQILRSNKDIPGMKKTIDDTVRGKVKFSCVECDQSFLNSYHASRHAEGHRSAPKRCYYCGEIRKGSMDLRMHFMRTHKSEGVGIFTCSYCNRGFTSLSLFEKHTDPRGFEHACPSSEPQYDTYYEELPVGTTIDQMTLNRLNFYRKKHDERETQEQRSEADTEPIQMIADAEATAKTDPDSDIFDGSDSLIQTEFGLKKLGDYRMSSQFRTRAVKRVNDSRGDEGDGEPVGMKKERVLMAQNGYFEHQESQESQQQNVARRHCCMNFSQTPTFCGYDLHNGIYDFQRMHPYQNGYQNYDYQTPFLPAYPDLYSNSQQTDSSDSMKKGVNETANIDLFPLPDTPMKNDMVDELLTGDGKTDTVFEELNKLNFAMPPSNENDCDDDLTDFINI